MKKTITSLLAVAAIAAFCMVFVACEDQLLEPTYYVTEYYRISNSTNSDLSIELHDGQQIVIEPDQEQEVRKLNMVYEPGIAYSRSMYTVDRAVMRIDGEVVPGFVWLFEYWDSTSADGPDEYHSSLTYTLTVTDELVEDVVTRNASLIRVTRDYRIINRISKNLVIKLPSGETTTIEPGGEQMVHRGEESMMEPSDIDRIGYSSLMYPSEMKIDGVAANILQYIWWSGYWEREYVPEDANTGGFIYTLTVTDELLENLKYHKKPKQP